MYCEVAALDDIDEILKLHFRYHVDSISEEDKPDGFVTTPFTPELLAELITEEQGAHIIRDEDVIAGYAMAASWKFWSKWPMFQYMIERLGEVSVAGKQVTVDNSYQYGPICIGKEYRGRGTLENLFDFSRRQMEERYPILITFINQNNPRSLAAHERKLGLKRLLEFDFNNNHYWELGYNTSRPVIVL